LTVISAFEDWGGSSMSWMPDPELMERHRRELAAQLEDDADALRAEHPGLRITSEAILGEPVSALLEHTATSQLTVLGTRGHGRVASVLLGSISQAVLQHAEGAVLVVPPPCAETGAGHGTPTGHNGRHALEPHPAASDTRRNGRHAGHAARPRRPPGGRRRDAVVARRGAALVAVGDRLHGAGRRPLHAGPDGRGGAQQPDALPRPVRGGHARGPG